MRLYNIYYTCRELLKDIIILDVDDSVNGTKKITNWNTYKTALERLSRIDFIRNDAMAAYNVLTSMDREKEIPDIGINTYRALMAKKSILLTKVNAVIDLYESMREDVSGNGIDMKIPICDSLEEYIRILADINFVINQCPYLRNENETIKFKGTDIGSEWITFAVITSGAAGGVILYNMAVLIHKAMALASERVVLDAQCEMLETLRLRNEAIQETINAFRKMEQITYEKYVAELQKELGELENGEEEGKAAKSLEKLSDLISKGVEIYTSIETPQEIKNLFPPVEEQRVLTDRSPQNLEDKEAEIRKYLR